ncbi:MAG: poly(R)-hydroxyalkanoic acid synthase subunit PhaE, partial [Pseudoxanthomonas sp.]
MHDSDQDLAALLRQAWGGWGDAFRQMTAAPSAASWLPGSPWPSPVPAAWAVGGWPGAAMPGFVGTPGFTGLPGLAPADPLAGLERMAREWLERMQETAAGLVGGESSPAQIAEAWRKALGATPERPDPDLFGHFFAHGLAGIEQASAQLQAWLQAVQAPWQRWAHLPAFGPAREHQERWQALLAAQGELQESLAGFQQLLEQAGREAFELFEGKLTELAESDRQIDSARGLFDLWIDAAEEAWSTLALSPQFQQAYGALANAQLKVRAGLQREIEQTCVAMGIPGRTEVEESSRKIAELERALRRLRAAMARAGKEEETVARAAAPVAPAAEVFPPTKPPPRKAGASKTGARKAAKAAKAATAKASPSRQTSAATAPRKTAAVPAAPPSSRKAAAENKKPAANKPKPKPAPARSVRAEAPPAATLAAAPA